MKPKKTSGNDPAYNAPLRIHLAALFRVHVSPNMEDALKKADALIALHNATEVPDK